MLVRLIGLKGFGNTLKGIKRVV